MVAYALKSDDGCVWACKNYDGDVIYLPKATHGTEVGCNRYVENLVKDVSGAEISHQGRLQQIMFSKFEYDGKLNSTFVEGPFQLPLSSIRAYLAEPITPRFIHVGSAGYQT